jgi:hypothetical protein
MDGWMDGSGDGDPKEDEKYDKETFFMKLKWYEKMWILISFWEYRRKIFSMNPFKKASYFKAHTFHNDRDSTDIV